jgi:hypothetical protein
VKRIGLRKAIWVSRYWGKIGKELKLRVEGKYKRIEGELKFCCFFVRGSFVSWWIVKTENYN